LSSPAGRVRVPAPDIWRRIAPSETTSSPSSPSGCPRSAEGSMEGAEEITGSSRRFGHRETRSTRNGFASIGHGRLLDMTFLEVLATATSCRGPSTAPQRSDRSAECSERDVRHEPHDPRGRHPGRRQLQESRGFADYREHDVYIAEMNLMDRDGGAIRVSARPSEVISLALRLDASSL
jgi:hypothetical protein